MLPQDILDLIHDFAAYWPEEWIQVEEHKKGDYGWLPQPQSVEELINLPMWWLQKHDESVGSGFQSHDPVL